MVFPSSNHPLHFLVYSPARHNRTRLSIATSHNARHTPTTKDPAVRDMFTLTLCIHDTLHMPRSDHQSAKGIHEGRVRGIKLMTLIYRARRTRTLALSWGLLPASYRCKSRRETVTVYTCNAVNNIRACFPQYCDGDRECT